MAAYVGPRLLSRQFADFPSRVDPDESKHRQASVSADYRLRWAGAAEGIAFLAAERDVAKLGPNDSESGLRLADERC